MFACSLYGVPSLHWGSLGIALFALANLGFTDTANDRYRLLDKGASYLTRKGIALP